MNKKDKAKVKTQLKRGVGYTWDECHKIYIALDDNQVEVFKQYGYTISLIDKNNIDNDVAVVENWYDNSCPLRFINAVKTDIGNDDIFIDVVKQK